MKLFSKIAILAAIIAFLGSCQKEEIPSPAGSGLQSTSNQRVSGSSASGNSDPSISRTAEDKNTTPGDIVSGGDDDHNGGGRILNPSPPDADSVGTIVSGGDDDKDGGSSSGKKKGG